MAIDLNKPYTPDDFGAGVAASIAPTAAPPIQFPGTSNTPLMQPQPQIQFPGVSNAPLMNSLSAPPAPEQDPEIAEILAMMKPQTGIQDQYASLLKEQPQREKPGWGRRIIAGLGTLQQGPEGSQEAAEKYTYAPYYREMENFGRKERILKDLSDNERQANINNRQIGATVLTDLRARNRLEETQRHNKQNEENDRAVTQIKLLMEQNPNLGVEFETDGTILLVDKKSGNITRTQYKGQSMSEFQRLYLTNIGMGARDQLNDARTKEMLEMRLAHEKAMAELRAQLEAKADKEKPMSEADKLLRQYNLAQEFYNTDPEGKKFITLGAPGANRFKLNKPEEVSSFWKVFGSDVEGQNRAIADKYIAIAKKIYGNDVVIPQSVLSRASKPSTIQPSARSTAVPQTGRPAGIPDNYIRVKEKASGRNAWIDPARFNATQHERIK